MTARAAKRLNAVADTLAAIAARLSMKSSVDVHDKNGAVGVMQSVVTVIRDETRRGRRKR